MFKFLKNWIPAFGEMKKRRHKANYFSLYFIFNLLLIGHAFADSLEPVDFSFSGTVKEGEIYTHKLPEDLFFHLYPTSYGWTISINPSEDKVGLDHGFLSSPEVPVRLKRPDPWSINFGSVGPDLIADKLYSDKRSFEFGLNSEDAQIISDAYECHGLRKGLNVDQLKTISTKKCKLGPLPLRRGFIIFDVKKMKRDLKIMHFEVKGEYRKMGYNF